MRATLLSWLPHDLRGLRILDAGCGTGALAVEAARRGASVVAIDLSPTLVDWPASACRRPDGRAVDFRSGDMLDPALGELRPRGGMDSLIHYEPPTRCACCRAGPAHPRLDAVHLRAEHAAAGHDARRGPPVPARRPRALDRAGGRALRRC
jgi:SAM-dependent methyltransferase